MRILKLNKHQFSILLHSYCLFVKLKISDQLSGLLMLCLCRPRLNFAAGIKTRICQVKQWRSASDLIQNVLLQKNPHTCRKAYNPAIILHFYLIFTHHHPHSFLSISMIAPNMLLFAFALVQLSLATPTFFPRQAGIVPPNSTQQKTYF